MSVITYPCRGPGILWHPKVIVNKRRWVRVLRIRAAINEMLWLCHLPMIPTVLRSFGPPRLKRLNQIRRWNRYVGNLMNVTPRIFFQQLQLPTVRCTSHSGTVQFMHTVICNRSLPSERWLGNPKHLMLRSQICSCQFPENLQWKREL